MAISLKRSLFSGFLVLLFGTVFMVAVLSVYLFVEYEAEKERILLKNESIVIATQKTLDLELRTLFDDMQFLTSVTQKALLTNGFDAAKSELSDLFLSAIVHKQGVLQARFLDVSGKEVIRVVRAGQTPVIASKDQLQNKKDRYYFADAISLPSASVAVSRLDLNVEEGKIEQPYNPVIRLSSPVHDQQDRKLGVLVINFSARSLIEAINHLKRDPNQELYLLDENLDWVIAPETQTAWGTQLGLGDQNLMHYAPLLAQKITQNRLLSGEFSEQDQHLYVATATPFAQKSLLEKGGIVVNRAPYFYVLASFPETGFWLTQFYTNPKVTAIFVSVLLLLLVTSAIVSLGVYRRQQLQRKAEYQQSLMESFFDHAPEIMFISDSIGDLVYENRDAKSLFVNKDRLNPESNAQIFTASERAELWQSMLNKRNDAVQEVFFWDQGQQRFFYRQCFLIADEGGDSFLMATILTELTSLKTAQQQLEDNEARIRFLLDAAPDGILVSNPAGEIILSNSKSQEMFEISQEEFLHKTIEDLLPSSYKHPHQALRNHYFANPKPRMMSSNSDVMAESTSGRKFHVDISLSPIKRQDQTEVISIIRDVTERRKFESHLKQTQKMDALGQLTGGIAHDFNNLLTSIIGNLDLAQMLLAKEGDNRDKVNEKLDIALNASLKAGRLTKRLLAFARKQSLSPKVIDLGLLLEDELDILTSAVGKTVNLHTRVQEGLWLTCIDSEELTSSLINLAVNARDAMPNGGDIYISIENLRVREDSLEILNGEVPSGDYIQLSVTDTGEGIDPEYLEKIFEPFFTTKSRDKGTGLGLSMVFGFVKQSNGFLKVYSEQGFGTTFKFFFPRQEDETGQNLALVTQQQRAKKPDFCEADLKGTAKILLVDDESDLRSLGYEYLSEAGYKVYLAEDALSAMQLLECNEDPKFDMVFTDIIMPGKNGFELALEIQDKWPDLPVIFTSGFPEDALKNTKAFRSGIVLVDKPYRRVQLLETISRELKNSENSQVRVE